MDVARARTLLEVARPDLQIRSIDVMDEGWESLVLDVNGELIAKLPRAAWAEEKYRREQRVLEAIAGGIADIAVPRPQLIDGEPMIQIYDKLPGEMLMADVESQVDLNAIGMQLGRFLKRLHSLDRDVVRRTGLDPAEATRWVERWRRLIAKLDADLLPLLSATARDNARAFFDTEITEELGVFRAVLTHADVGGWNILVDVPTSSVTALIDWGDAEIGDPAFDFTAVRADHSRALFDALVAGYGSIPDDGFGRRVETYARLYPLYSAFFARQVGRTSYEERYLAMAETTFGAGASRL